MGDFFKPWRRIFGVFTLVVTLISTVGWVRSLVIRDTIIFPYGESMTHIFSSGRGQISWHTQTIRNSFWDWNSQRIREKSINGLQLLQWPFGAEDRYVDTGRKVFMRLWWVSYWTIVFPLFALSAFLLLTKPRQSTPMKTSVPTPADGI